MSHAVVLSGSLLAFLSRGCCLLGEHRRLLGQCPVLIWKAPDVPEQGHGQMESYDVIWGQALALWWNGGWKEVVLEAVRKTPVHVSGVSSTGSTLLRELAVCPSGWNEKWGDKDKWWRQGLCKLTSWPGLGGITSVKAVESPLPGGVWWMLQPGLGTEERAGPRCPAWVPSWGTG